MVSGMEWRGIKLLSNCLDILRWNWRGGKGDIGDSLDGMELQCL